MFLHERPVVIGDGINVSYSGKDHFPPSSKSREGVGNNTANSNLQITGHHLSVDGDRSAAAGLSQISAIIEWMMVIDREPVQYFLP
jgi:hypothetical protein